MINLDFKKMILLESNQKKILKSQSRLEKPSRIYDIVN